MGEDSEESMDDEGSMDDLVCCEAMTAECQACKENMSVEEWCALNPTDLDCEITEESSMVGLPECTCGFYFTEAQNGDEACQYGNNCAPAENCGGVRCVLSIESESEESEDDEGSFQVCCEMMSAECEACKEGVSVEEFCAMYPGEYDCEDADSSMGDSGDDDDDTSEEEVCTAMPLAPPQRGNMVPDGDLLKYTDGSLTPEICGEPCFGSDCYTQVDDSCGAGELFTTTEDFFEESNCKGPVNLGEDLDIYFAGGCTEEGKFFYGEMCGGSTFGSFNELANGIYLGLDPCNQPEETCVCNAYVYTETAGCFNVGTPPDGSGNRWFMRVNDPVCTDVTADATDAPSAAPPTKPPTSPGDAFKTTYKQMFLGDSSKCGDYKEDICVANAA